MADQLDLFGPPPEGSRPTAEQPPADYSILHYRGEVVCLRIENKQGRYSTAELRLRAYISQLDRCDLPDFCRAVTDWLKTKNMGNHVMYWMAYRLKLIDDVTVELWHLNEQIDFDRHVCTIRQFTPAVFRDSWLDKK